MIKLVLVAVFILLQNHFLIHIQTHVQALECSEFIILSIFVNYLKNEDFRDKSHRQVIYK